MRSIVFDTGPIISLTMNSLIWILSPLKKQFNGSFLIAESVKKELVDRPLQTKKFRFEALHTLEYINNSTLSVVSHEETKDLTMHLLTIANNIFSARGQKIKIVTFADIDTVSVALKMGSEAIITDERTLRDLVERPYRLLDVLRRKLHTDIDMDRSKLDEFKKAVNNLKVLRSAEIITVAFNLGILDRYLPEDKNRETLLSALLWAAKLNGCAISEEELNNIISLEAGS